MWRSCVFVHLRTLNCKVSSSLDWDNVHVDRQLNQEHRISRLLESLTIFIREIPIGGYIELGEDFPRSDSLTLLWNFYNISILVCDEIVNSIDK